MKIIPTTILFMCILVAGVISLTGNVCSRQLTRLEIQRGCSYYWWGDCCAYKNFSKTLYETVIFCCPGWREAGPNVTCTQAICNPLCRNGGTCTRPGVCSCPPAYSGRICAAPTCSALFPCFPGVCPGPGTASCTCTNGYTGTGSDMCNKLAAQKPIVTNVVTHLEEIDRMLAMIVYRLVTDATGDDEAATFWSNLDKFNRLNAHFESLHEQSDSIPSYPYYVSDFKMGIIKATAEAQHISSEFGDISRPIFHDPLDFTCGTDSNKVRETPSVSWQNPSDAVYVCNHTFVNLYNRIYHNDTITVTVSATNGGYRTVDGKKHQIYGHTDSKKTHYRFDFVLPVPCSRPCSFIPLDIQGSDITRNGFNIMWDGWYDELSGIKRYVWEIFKLENNNLSQLTEPVKPIKLTEIIATGQETTRRYEHSYTPPIAGMYSVVLEVSDRAYNSEYVRRLVLYDPDSTVTINTDSDADLFISSATADTGYTWQSNITDQIIVVWTNHFINLVHRDGGLLNEVLPYPDRLDRKHVRSEYDHNEGNRTLAAIDNSNGIVQFEIGFHVSSSFSGLLHDPLNWGVLPTLDQSHVINVERRAGDAMRIWVRGTDIFGETKTDETTILFDITAPLIAPPTLLTISTSTEPFSSMIEVVSEDQESGVWKIQMDFISIDTGAKLATRWRETREIKTREECDRQRDCYPSLDGHFYNRTLLISMNHCWIRVTKSQLNQQIRVDVTAVNMASLMTKSNISINLGRVKDLPGLEEFTAPKNIEAINMTTNSATLKWSNIDNCYNRTGLHYRYSHIIDGSTVEIDKVIEGNIEQITVEGINDDTEYNVTLSSIYDTDESDTVSFSFKTEKHVVTTPTVSTPTDNTTTVSVCTCPGRGDTNRKTIGHYCVLFTLSLLLVSIS